MTRWLLAALALVACNGPERESVTSTVPPRETFAPVGEMLHARCGSLDCHGQVGRSLRIYGTNGLRLTPGDVPGVDGGVTTDVEQDANYASVVGLEPEVLEQVTKHEVGVEQLRLVRKARALEAHKGGRPFAAGSPADQCLVEWLTNGVAEATPCAEGATIPQPPGF